MSSETAFIILELDEAELLASRNQLGSRHFLALKPAVYRFLKDNGADVNSAFESYTNFAHARTAVLQKMGMDEFETAIRQAGIYSETTIQSALNIIFYYFALSGFIFNSIKGYKNYEWLDDGQVKSGGYQQAFLAIATRLLNKRFGKREVIVSGLHARFMDFYNDYLLNRVIDKKVHLIVDGARASSKNFAENLRKLDADNEFISLNVRHTSKSMFVSLKHMIRSRKILKGRKEGFPALLLYSKDTSLPQSDFIKTAINNSKSLFIKTTLQIAEPIIMQNIRSYAGYEEPTRKWISRLEPEVITTDAIANAMVMTASKTAREHGGNVVFFNHGAISNQTPAISKFVTLNWSKLGRAYSEFATHHVPRTQSVADLIGVLSNGRADNLYAIANKPIKKIEKTAGKFRFLLAGNFTSLENHIPWVTETPEEFIEGIKEIAAAIAKIDNAELVIRIKAGNSKSADVGYENLRDDLAGYPNVTVKNTGSFKEDLAQSDAMISNLSTTIDEALQENVPVILQSARKRYFYLDEDASTQKGRKAVYAVTSKTNLDDLLKKVMGNHTTPLTPQETAPYLWSIKPVPLDEFIRQTCGI